jgi:hypothetical protein
MRGGGAEGTRTFASSQQSTAPSSIAQAAKPLEHVVLINEAAILTEMESGAGWFGKLRGVEREGVCCWRQAEEVQGSWVGWKGAARELSRRRERKHRARDREQQRMTSISCKTLPMTAPKADFNGKAARRALNVAIAATTAGQCPSLTTGTIVTMDFRFDSPSPRVRYHFVFLPQYSGNVIMCKGAPLASNSAAVFNERKQDFTSAFTTHAFDIGCCIA